APEDLAGVLEQLVGHYGDARAERVGERRRGGVEGLQLVARRGGCVAAADLELVDAGSALDEAERLADDPAADELVEELAGDGQADAADSVVGAWRRRAAPGGLRDAVAAGAGVQSGHRAALLELAAHG